MNFPFIFLYFRLNNYPSGYPMINTFSEDFNRSNNYLSHEKLYPSEK